MLVSPPNSGSKMNTEKIAAEFTAILKEWLGEDFKEVVERNRTETDSGICHSHDFCDANMAMEEAFKKVVGREPFLSEDEGEAQEKRTEEDSAVWSAAWDIAKASWQSKEMAS